MIPPALSARPLSVNVQHTVDELLDLLGDAWVLHVVLQSLGVLLSILQNLSPKVCQFDPRTSEETTYMTGSDMISCTSGSLMALWYVCSSDSVDRSL
jgi:hypothetical protein